MSFSYEVKKELTELEAESEKKITAELCGIFLFGGLVKDSYLNITFENETMVSYATNLINKFNSVSKFTIKYCINKKVNSKLSVILIDIENNIFKKFFNIEKINKKLYCYFLKGVFLSCASIANPENEYHLEFNINSTKLYDILIHTFETCDLLQCTPKLAKRRDSYIAYIKDGEKITDFLAFIGASQSAMKLMQIKILKEVRNNVNRTTNFETANLSKTANSSAQQIDAIKKIKEKVGLHFLPEYLQETAQLRLSNPYVSLKELAALYKCPISKSGVNHRLQKIIKISNNI